MNKKTISFILIAFIVLIANNGYPQDDSDEIELDTPFESLEGDLVDINTAPSEVKSKKSQSENVEEKKEFADIIPSQESSQPEELIDLGSLDAPSENVPTNVESIQDSDLADLEKSDEMLEPLSNEGNLIETKVDRYETVNETEKSEDDLDGLKKDTELTSVSDESKTPEIKVTEPVVFDVGREERELLTMAQNIQGQISDSQWNELATASKTDSYTVVQNDWLFKISKRLFGSGFYYPKIWSLNSFITNPHFIEPGMVLSFTTGSSSQAPEVKLGTFSEDELNAVPGSIVEANMGDIANFGEDTNPAWTKEKSELQKQGVFFQYASQETMEDLNLISQQALNREYENYEPPKSDFEVVIPKNYDELGFDKTSKILYSFKEGFYLRTFLSTNIVQDFGSITNGPDENIFFMTLDRAYVKFDESMNVLAGDKFSVYSSGGKIQHENSDRQGYKYSIVGHIKVLRKIKDKWEVEFIEVSGTPQRGDRITSYTPKIERITRTYNSRLIEAGIMAAYEPRRQLLGYGDVVYLDRGRADGVELGNVFEVFGFKDRATFKNITDQPTYKVGEMSVITVTDNFATAIISKSSRDFYVGDIAMTKTKAAHLREERARDGLSQETKELKVGKALEELDVELNLENLNDDLLKEADRIELTEDELAELERQEREKSVIKDSERDLKALERLENEIEQAEKILNDANLDEDKLLDQQNLDEIEKKQKETRTDSLDELEENLGKRYVDEDLNSKENPYGLTEFDVEEVDELLNTEKKQQNNE